MNEKQEIPESDICIRDRMNEIDTVLFDFDGVLFKTIEDHYASWDHAFGYIGKRVRWEDFAVLEGQNFYTIARQLGELYGVPDSDMAKIAEMKNKHYFKHHRPEPYPDAIQAIEKFISFRWSLGIVTGGYRERIIPSLPESWKSRFQVMVSADDVKRTKPDPEPYQLAALKLNKDSRQCLVVENAPLGVKSAVSAGMYCIAVTTTLPADYLREADFIASGMTEAVQHIMAHRS